MDVILINVGLIVIDIGRGITRSACNDKVVIQVDAHFILVDVDIVGRICVIQAVIAR